MRNNPIVQKLWSLCDILRDDGINYSDYVTELVLLLFIKMEYENVEAGALKAHRLPSFARWPELVNFESGDLLVYYRSLLKKMSSSSDAIISSIYFGAKTNIRQNRHLELIVKEIDALDWFSAKRDGLGDLYEGLLDKNASETKSGAGQYFTPRSLVDSIVAVIKPQPHEIIQDPAAGTGGFLIAANQYIRATTGNLRNLDEKARQFQMKGAYHGMELVPETRRLALMNCLLHDIEGGKSGPVRLGSTLGEEGISLPPSDVIFSNPPFGTARGGGGCTRSDLNYPTANKQLVFLQHIYHNLKIGGRAAVILPDNVLFDAVVGTQVRRELMDLCSVHTILRLPTGIFYAPGVKTNVLFFTKCAIDSPLRLNKTWIYDMRTDMPKFGKRTPFDSTYFVEFEKAYGIDPNGLSTREEVDGRWRCFSRDWIAERGDSLDINWESSSFSLEETIEDKPSDLISHVIDELSSIMNDLRTLMNDLGDEEK